MNSKKRGEQSTQICGQSQHPRYLAYALPRWRTEQDILHVLECDGLSLHDEPLGADLSFLDFEGLVTFAGVYETIHESYMSRRMQCTAKADLDLRQREIFSLLGSQKFIIFLVSNIPRCLDSYPVEADSDLFRSIVLSCGIDWNSRKTPYPAVKSIVPEFRDYVARYGTGYAFFHIDDEHKEWIKTICTGNDAIYGISLLGDQLFFLPCVTPQNHQQALDIVVAAIQAAIAYRRRLSQEMPEWTTEFSFEKESQLRYQVIDLRKQTSQIEGQIDSYISFKGALCYRSDPLVEVIRKILNHFSDIALTIDDKCIEDATIRDEQGQTLAVVEIKGVNKNITRENINQVDSHRERLSLPPTTPGILIMNTLMGVNSIKEKDQQPHPDIIQKAVLDRVLLVRTLDLLRYADGIDKGIFSKEAFKKVFLTESGWLKVENDTFQIVKE
jgi:hypothetical protein